eukprot:CAMPEP_0114240374 /NCGR_PEP_ID=MMETSP0058-20121206/9036_1 /TAXON_ID=36894 /ORGANISM="Pyramimonas parkeae, CCMP726" /LENGTH=112 /DNA_ID=CAMNT_0001352771 /DNA_START=215 /DNA_END=550 /DNA_ORIENTATION=-
MSVSEQITELICQDGNAIDHASSCPSEHTCLFRIPERMPLEDYAYKTPTPPGVNFLGALFIREPTPLNQLPGCLNICLAATTRLEARYYATNLSAACARSSRGSVYGGESPW